MMYPGICKPLLWAAIQVRIHRSMRMISNGQKRFREEVQTICDQYPIEDKIKLSTVLRMVKDFGLSTF